MTESRYWMRDLDDPCSHGIGTSYACKSRATKEVMGPFNSSYGRFCGKHARDKKRSLEREATKTEAK